jgi:hypothetical protein
MRPEIEQAIRSRAAKLANLEELGDLQVYAAAYLDRHLLLLEIDDLRTVVQRLREVWPNDEGGQRLDADIAARLTPSQRAILGITDLAIDMQRQAAEANATVTSTADIERALRGEGASGGLPAEVAALKKESLDEAAPVACRILDCGRPVAPGSSWCRWHAGID